MLDCLMSLLTSYLRTFFLNTAKRKPITRDIQKLKPRSLIIATTVLTQHKAHYNK